MKKTQVALAALALVASTAALADGVTVYGTLDVSAAKANSGSSHFDGAGNWNGSNFGLRGSEDLGSGMTASFNIEGGLNLATGGADNSGSAAGTFNRKANVGISSAVGTVTAGLQLSPFIGAALGGIANNNESFYVPMLGLVGNRSAGALATSGGNGAGTTGSEASAFFVNNSVSYTSPNISGVTVSALTRMSGGTEVNKYSAYSVSYAAGDLSVAFGHQDSKGYENFANVGLTGGAYTTSVLSGKYNLGDTSIGGAFFSFKDKDSSTTTKSTMVGIGHKVSDAINVGLQYVKNDAATSSSITNLGVQYKLSGSSYLYTTIGRATGGAASLYSTRGNGWEATNAGSTANETGYALGMVKSF